MQKRALIVLLAGLGILTGCGQDKASTVQTNQVPAVSHAKAVVLQGTVSNNSGLIKTGDILAKTLQGEVLATTRLENNARYQLEIPAGTLWPVVLHYQPANPHDGTVAMISVAIQPTTHKYDINPMTTAIANQAKALGGYTLTNLTRAAEDRVNVPDANKTSSGFRGDPTTQYGGWH